MTDIAALISDMVKAGVDPDIIGRTAAALAEREPVFNSEEPKRSAGAERQARYRARMASQSVTSDVTSVTVTDAVSPKKETSPTPPKEKTTPSQSETNVSSKTPRAALETVLDADRAGQVIEHRKRIRKPLTIRAAELLAGQFAECPEPNAAADAMVLNGWQGFKPEWMQRQQVRGSPPRQPAERYDPFKALSLELNDEQDRSHRSDRSNRDDAQGFPVLTIDHQRR